LCALETTYCLSSKPIPSSHLDEPYFILPTPCRQLIELVRELAYNKNLRLLGFSFSDDVAHLVALDASLKPDAFKRVIDIQAKALKQLALPRPPSLSNLCRRLLGKPINKRNQRSNWERRPLRPDQLEYAAMDAVALLLLERTLSVS
jgi:hypothetical protein